MLRMKIKKLSFFFFKYIIQNRKGIYYIFLYSFEFLILFFFNFVFVVCTSVIWFLFSFPLLPARCIGSARPIRIQLHMQLTFSTGQFVIFGLFLPPKCMPLQRANKKKLQTRNFSHFKRNSIKKKKEKKRKRNYRGERKEKELMQEKDREKKTLWTPKNQIKLKNCQCVQASFNFY